MHKVLYKAPQIRNNTFRNDHVLRVTEITTSQIATPFKTLKLSNRTLHKHTQKILAFQSTITVFIAKAIRLVFFRGKCGVYFEIHTKHTYKLYESTKFSNIQRTSTFCNY